MTVSSSLPALQPGKHPNSGDGLWGTSTELPSFLYAMPLDGSRVFLEETCLVSKPALPFAVLKRRLERRLAAMGIKVRCPCGLRCTTLPRLHAAALISRLMTSSTTYWF